MRISLLKLGYIFFSLLFFTLFRSIYILIAGLIPLILYYFAPYRIPILKFGTLFLPMVLIAAIGILNTNTPFQNILFSLYITFPVIVLVFVNPQKISIDEFSENSRFLGAILNILMVVNNLFGIIQMILFHHGDAYVGIYGRHSIGHHGLALLNSSFFVFYFAKYYWLKERTLTVIFYMMFYFVGHFLGFFGLGTLFLLFSIGVIIVLEKFSIKVVIKVVSMAVMLTFGLYLLNPLNVFDYMASNLMFVIHIFDNNIELLPGKVRMFVESYNFLSEDVEHLLLGGGPGGFNSRTAFLLNIDSSNLLTAILGNTKPILHEKIIHPLWDMGVVDVLKFNDGTRNQPFSSLTALLCEYGLVFSLIVGCIFIKEIRHVKNKLVSLDIDNKEKLFVLNLFKILTLFFVLNLIGENMIEMSEGMLFMIFMFYIKLYVRAKEN